MIRLVLALALGIAGTASLAAAAAATGEDCRKAYVIPYAEQCAFDYSSLAKDRSPANLSAAFAACARAQDAAVSCVKTTDSDLHAIALGALVRDVTRQAAIAMVAQQFSVAEALLREKLQVFDVIAADGKRDAELERARAATRVDLADATAGTCTTRVTAAASAQRELARSRRYAELAGLLKRKSQAYATCSKLATSPAKRAYIEYVGLVALEESGRAEQAAGARRDANELYRICSAGARRSKRYAVAPVTNFLETVALLCGGRASGKYAVDQPERLDADPGTFKPLTLPRS
ncbi:MAG: hypothetical protein NVSMB21_20410 [Vulcanimicrobiaceae bacterium]